MHQPPATIIEDVTLPHSFWSDPTGIFRICWNPVESSGHFWQGVPLKSHSIFPDWNRQDDQNGWHSFPVDSSGMNRNHANIS
jgi:hypothetical protein